MQLLNFSKLTLRLLYPSCNSLVCLVALLLEIIPETL